MNTSFLNYHDPELAKINLYSISYLHYVLINKLFQILKTSHLLDLVTKAKG